MLAQRSRPHIATHQGADADALVALWLVSRWLFPGTRMRVAFVPRSYRVDDQPKFDGVLDVGCRYDPRQLVFDHKPPAVWDRHRTYTARLLWDYLLAEGHEVSALADLIDTVHDGDSARRRGRSSLYRQSRRDGLHARVREARDRHGDDDRRVWTLVRRWLDGRYGPSALPATQPSARWRRYGRGRVYLQSLESANEPGTFHDDVLMCFHKRPALAAWDRRWRIADALAARWAVGRATIRADACFAFTVDSIIEHCGTDVRTPILCDTWRLSEQLIGRISRSSGERQRFELQEVRDGRRPFSRQTDVYDTVCFDEVPSRLARAEGLIKAALKLIAPTTGNRETAHQESLRALVALCEGCERHLSEPDGAHDARCTVVEPAIDTPPRGSRANAVASKLAQACGFMRKNLRDLPRSLKEHPPTEPQRREALARLRRIRAMLLGWVNADERLPSPPPPALDDRWQVWQRDQAPPIEGGIYVAGYRLWSACEITIGRLGSISFQAGCYLYVGSAQRRLAARLLHHAKRAARPRWHADYFGEYARLLGAYYLKDAPRAAECELAQHMACDHRLATVGFGASDCGCRGHLFCWECDTGS